MNSREHTKINTRVECTAGAEQVQGRFAVITLTSAVHLSLRKHDQGSSRSVPLQLDLIALEEALLGDRCRELRDDEHLNLSRLTLALGNEHRNGLSLTRRQCEVRNTLHAQLVPDSRQVIALVELNFVGHSAGAQPLIRSVLQVPASLRLLDEAAHDRVLISGLNGTPDLQILDGISVLVLRRALPGDHVGAERGEAQLEHVLGRDGADDMAHGRVNNGDPV